MNCAIAPTDPLSSMSLPKSAPRRNSGKNDARNPAAEPMNVCVQCASSGSPAARRGDQPRRRREDEHAPAAERQPHEDAQAEQDAGEAHER